MGAGLAGQRPERRRCARQRAHLARSPPGTPSQRPRSHRLTGRRDAARRRSAVARSPRQQPLQDAWRLPPGSDKHGIDHGDGRRRGEQRPSEDRDAGQGERQEPHASTAPRAAAASRGWGATMAGLRRDLRRVGAGESLSTWPTRPPRTRAGHRRPDAWPAPVAGNGQPLPGPQPDLGSRWTPSPAVAVRRCGCCRRATGGGS